MKRDTPSRTRSTHSRRTVLRAAAAGTAAMGLLAASRTFAAAAAANTHTTEGSSSPIVAYIADARKDELVVMIGTSEIVHRDARLVARIVAIAREAGDVVAS